MSYEAISYKDGMRFSNSTTDEGASPVSIGTGNMIQIGNPGDQNEIISITTNMETNEYTSLGDNVKKSVVANRPIKLTTSNYLLINGIPFYLSLGKKVYSSASTITTTITTVTSSTVLILDTSSLGTADAYKDMLLYNSTKKEYCRIISHNATTVTLEVATKTTFEAADVIIIYTGMMFLPYTSVEGKKPRVNFASVNAYVDSSYQSIEAFACDATQLELDYNDGKLSTTQEFIAMNWNVSDANPTIAYAGDEDKSYSLFDSFRFESGAVGAAVGSDADMILESCKFILTHDVKGVPRDRRYLELFYSSGIGVGMTIKAHGYYEQNIQDLYDAVSGKLTWVMRKQDTSKFFVVRVNEAYPYQPKLERNNGEIYMFSGGFLGNGVWIFVKDDLEDTDITYPRV